MGWPDVQQVFEIVRIRQVKGKAATREVVYGFTSLAPQQAGPAELLAASRGHWGIENELHGVRDGTLGEDRCRVRTGQSPRVLASLRNLAVHVLTQQVRSKTYRNRAEACRHNHAQPEVPLRLLTQK
jgi:predicted transposase YbfD/YdcC